MLLVRKPETLPDLTEALGVYDTRELLDKEHMYKRFNPQVHSFSLLFINLRSSYVITGLIFHRRASIGPGPLLLQPIMTLIGNRKTLLYTIS